MCTSVVAESEAAFGVVRLPEGRKKKELQARLAEAIIDVDEVLPVTRPVGSAYAAIKADLWSRGRPQGDNDLWIAATALAHDMILVTNDASFRNIRGLAVEDWSQD